MDADADDGADALTPTTSTLSRYEGEDTSPTSAQELQGWYCYGMAAEVFAVVGVGSFLQVTMEQLARENGVLWSDRTVPCVASSSAANKIRAESGGAASGDKDQCVFAILGMEMTTSSFVMYTSSIAVAFQALTLVSFSTFADYGKNRKRLLLSFGFTGAITAMAFVLITPSTLPFGSLLTVIAVTCLGCSFVMLNSFLPLLSSNHPSVRVALKTGHARDNHQQQPANRNPPLPAAMLSNKISSRGVALGYGAAVFVQCLAIGTLLLASRFTTSRTFPLRLILFLTGAWWAAMMTPTALLLRSRPGPPLPFQLADPSSVKSYSLRLYASYLKFAWSSLFSTLRTALLLRQLRLFLLAWFFLSDSVATVGSVAILFARTTLALPPAGIAGLSITATVSGITGSLMWPVVSKKYSLSTNRTIVYCMLLMEFVPIYGLLGYLPPIQRLGVGGLQQSWEIFPLAAIYGIAQGGLSSYCRSFYGQLIPPGHEAAFYALFAITDKGSSAIGPAIVGRITDKTGSIRLAFVFLLVLISLPILLVRKVDEEDGRREAEAMSSKLRPPNAYDEFELSESSVQREGLMQSSTDSSLMHIPD